MPNTAEKYLSGQIMIRTCKRGIKDKRKQRFHYPGYQADQVELDRLIRLGIEADEALKRHREKTKEEAR